MAEKPHPIIMKALQNMANSVAALAEQSAEKWADVPGDVTLQMFAKAIRNTNLATFADTDVLQ